MMMTIVINAASHWVAGPRGRGWVFSLPVEVLLGKYAHACDFLSKLILSLLILLLMVALRIQTMLMLIIVKVVTMTIKK